MTARLRSESGFALIGVLLILIILMGIGISLVAISDTQQNVAGGERVKESSYNLAEAALNAEALQLGRSWPTSSTTACNPTTSSASWCPQASTNGTTPSFMQAYRSQVSGDYASACPGSPSTQLWQTQVNDNIISGGQSSQYWTSAVSSQPTYDANGDGTVWVRAWATVQCKPISVVGLVSLTSLALTLPKTVVSANWLATSNQGNKVIVDTLGAYAQPPLNPPPTASQASKIVLRCSGLTSAQCQKFPANKGQIQPPTVQANSTSASQTLTATQLQTLEQQAASASCPLNTGNNGTCLWTTGCPTTAAQIASPASGAPVVVIGPCNISITGSGVINSSGAPGALVVENGSLTLGGTLYFYGLIYMVNKQASSASIMNIQGNATVQGSVLIDGNGGLTAGSSKTNLIYDQRATAVLKGATGASVNRGTIRVLPPSTP
jgi:Tfp pilus assembly protein PilX